MTLFIQRSLSASLFALSLMVFSAFSESGNHNHKSMISKVVSERRLVVGISVSEPWVMEKGAGQWLGYDIDVARQLAEDLGVDVQFKHFALDRLMPELLAGHVDIIISGLSITTPRNLSVNFSIPYANSGIRILANKKEAGQFNEMSDFNHSSVTLAVRGGSEAMSVAEKQFPQARIREYADESEMLAAVRTGRVQALLAATPYPEFMLDLYPDELAMPVTEPLQRSSEAMAIRKQDPDSMNVINNWILQRLESGWLQDRHDYWFISTEWRKRLQ